MQEEKTPLQEWVIEQDFPAKLLIEVPGMLKEVNIMLSGLKHTISASGRIVSDSGELTHQGKVRVVNTVFDHVVIMYYAINADQPVVLNRKVEGENIEMVFLLKGNVKMLGEALTNRQLDEGQHHMYYGAMLDNKFLIGAEDGNMEFLVVHLSGNRYLQLLKACGFPENVVADELVSQRLTDKSNLPLTPAMRWVINEIKNCQRSKTLKRIFLEAKVLELCMLQIEQMLQSTIETEHADSDSEPLTEAGKILEMHFAKPPTIQQLSKMVGLNEFYLKKRFKEAFSTTIFGYVNQLKMAHAKQLLLQNDKSVAEIAYAIGYKNPQHFTAAFKRYYGILPSEVKK